MPIETWLVFILGFLIVGSIIALEVRDVLSSIVAIGIVGLGVSIAFVFLQAPDLAIVQFLFEIFALVILVTAFVGAEHHRRASSRKPNPAWWLTVAALVALFALSIPAFALLPPFGEPLFATAQHYVAQGAAETGAANLVASILLDYRAYDTLGEVTVLFTAILGSLTILRIKIRERRRRADAAVEEEHVAA